jgi:hypothetical protein
VRSGISATRAPIGPKWVFDPSKRRLRAALRSAKLQGETKMSIEFYEGQQVEVYKLIHPVNDRNAAPLDPFYAWRKATIKQIPDYGATMEHDSAAFMVEFHCGGLHACNRYNIRPDTPRGAQAIHPMDTIR